MKQIKALLTVYLNLLGKDQGHKPGEWSIDYAACYGGYRIVQQLLQGGEHHPLIQRRLPKKEMISALEMSIETLRVYEAYDYMK